MVVEWSSPYVGNVVDFPFNWSCICYRSVICPFLDSSAEEPVFVAAEDTMR